MNIARIYIVAVQTKEGETSRLVKATNQAQALRYVARHTFTVAVASAVQVGELMAAGAKIEDATKEPIIQE